MRLKSRRLATLALVGVALLSFVIGIIVSSSLQITPSIDATEKIASENTEVSPVKDSQIFVKLAEKLKPATVNISTTKTIKREDRHFYPPSNEDAPFQDFFREDLFGRYDRRLPQRDFQLKNLGSGFSIDKDGYIITNNHVIEGADEIKVRLSNEEEYDARIVGRDAQTDIALIKINPPKGLAVGQLGDSDDLKVGE